MMSIFDELTESFWKNEEALSTEYLPKLLPHREGEIKLIAKNLLPASRMGKPQNMFIFGPPGIGKTAVVRFVFRDFEEYSERIKTVYLNCWDYNTAPSVLSKLVIELGFFIPRRGISKDEIKERLVEALKKLKKALIICLDEVDQLVKRDPSVLYDLSRLNQYVNVPVGLILISNDRFALKDVDARIKSTLALQEIEFKPYSLLEMKDILQERVKLAFRPGSVEEGVVLLVSNHAVKHGGDVRIGLECLLRAARHAEGRESKTITVDDVKSVLGLVKPVKPKIIEARLDESEKLLLEIIKERKELETTKAYEEFNMRSKVKLSDRRLRDYLRRLETLGLVETELVKGVKGKRRVVRYREN